MQTDSALAEEQLPAAPSAATEPGPTAPVDGSDLDPDAETSGAASDAAADAGGNEADSALAGKRRATRRPPKLDPLLAAAVDAARTGVLEIAPAEQIGEYTGVRAEDDRVVTHLFESFLPGYDGWQWFAVLTRVPRSKVVTVSEVGLLPSERSVLSPQWVPWAERVRPGEEEEHAEREQSRQRSGG